MVVMLGNRRACILPIEHDQRIHITQARVLERAGQSPDDVEMLELCQRGLLHSPVEWNELSKGVKAVEDARREVGGPDDEAQMRAYWAQWDLMMRNQAAFERGAEGKR